MKAYSHNGLAGCVIQVRNRHTGGIVGLYQAEQSGIEIDPATPWVTVCETHNTCVCHSTLALARSHLAAPWGWCEQCIQLE